MRVRMSSAAASGEAVVWPDWTAVGGEAAVALASAVGSAGVAAWTVDPSGWSARTGGGTRKSSRINRGKRTLARRGFMGRTVWG